MTTEPQAPSQARLDDLWLALYHVERTFEPSADGEALVGALVAAVLAAGWRPTR